MNDRELLELAAKAAGINLSYWCPTNNAFWCGEYWNPLTNDGDALRLAVKLGMILVIGPCEVTASTISGTLRGNFFIEDMVFNDDGSATRRAIVRAAAEIGKAMTQQTDSAPTAS